MNTNEERRLVEHNIEVRNVSEEGGYTIRGYAAVFNSPTLIRTKTGQFYEELRSDSFDRVLKGQDVVLVYQHNPDNILARSTSGTLRYGKDNTGIWYEADMPNTTLSRDLQVLIARGDISANSFAFGEITHSLERRNGVLHRTIESIGKLSDISIVTHPAYQDAVITSRSLDKAFEEIPADKPITHDALPSRTELLKRKKLFY